LQNNCQLSEIIYLNNLKTEDFNNSLEKNNKKNSSLEELFSRIKKSNLNLDLYKRKILS